MNEIADELQAHPVAALFPLMQGKDFEDLVADVRSNGLLQPIWLHSNGTILDGRNRYRACRTAGIEAQFKTWGGPDDGVVQFVTSMNLRRRHLSAEQRAFIAAELANMTQAGTRTRVDGEKHPAGVSEEEVPLVSRSEAASAMRVTPRAVERARSVVRHAPELREKVVSGEMTLTAAANKAAEQRRRDEEKAAGREAAVERGKAALQKKRQAERLQNIGQAVRRLQAWLELYGEQPDMRAATPLVRQAKAALEEQRERI